MENRNNDSLRSWFIPTVTFGERQTFSVFSKTIKVYIIEDIYTKSSFQENYGWQVSDVQIFEKPIEAKGQLSLWEYPID